MKSQLFLKHQRCCSSQSAYFLHLPADSTNGSSSLKHNVTSLATKSPIDTSDNVPSILFALIKSTFLFVN